MYGFLKNIDAGYDEAVARVTGALQQEGFGVLTEIDVKATLKKKLDVDFRRYTILGACNPPLAHKALAEEINIGLLLPCNVVVYENEDGTATVGVIDAAAMLSVVGRAELEPFAAEVSGKLKKVLEAV